MFCVTAFPNKQPAIWSFSLKLCLHRGNIQKESPPVGNHKRYTAHNLSKCHPVQDRGTTIQSQQGVPHSVLDGVPTGLDGGTPHQKLDAGTPGRNLEPVELLWDGVPPPLTRKDMGPVEVEVLWDGDGVPSLLTDRCL